eukprot:4611201-Ditylum_brightwellii.AAC.1
MGTAAMVNVTDIEGLFNVICWAEEPMVMLAMTALDKGKLVYSEIGTDALESHTLAFVGDTVNGQLSLLFSLTTGVGDIAADRTLGLIKGDHSPISDTPYGALFGSGNSRWLGRCTTAGKGAGHVGVLEHPFVGPKRSSFLQKPGLRQHVS